MIKNKSYFEKNYGVCNDNTNYNELLFKKDNLTCLYSAFFSIIIDVINIVILCYL